MKNMLPDGTRGRRDWRRSRCRCASRADAADAKGRPLTDSPKTLDPAGVTWILNPYDEFAIEQALRVKEQARRPER